MVNIKKHYQKLLKSHGYGPEAVQYSDIQSQMARFEILMQVDINSKSILDVGCGLGDLWAFMREKDDKSDYMGLDIVPEFVNFSNSRFNDNAKAILVDNLDILPKGYEYAVVSGMFNNKMENNWEFMTKTLCSMFEAAEKGIAFNAMSTYVDYYDDNLYYVDPFKVWQFCKNELGGYPVLRHDYSLKENGFPFEFAIYVYKKPNYNAVK